MIKFQDLYVTLAPETSDPADPGNVVFYNVQPTPTPSVDSTLCLPPNPPSTACCNPDGPAFSLKPFAIMLGAGEPERKIGKDVLLKDYLAAQLAKPEMKLSPVQEPGTLQTVAEIEALEHKLNGALGELQNRKAQLRKKSTVTK
jgi:hypothetical protein